LKSVLYILLYLNIYTCFFYTLQGQELYLSVEAENVENTRFLDSILSRKSFDNYRSLQVEADTLIYTLQRIGYIDSEVTSFTKTNDSTYLAKIKLGKPFNEIKVYYSKIDFNTKELMNIISDLSDDHFVIPFYRLEEIMNYLTLLKSEQGNTFVNIRLDNIHKEDFKTIVANLLVDGGNQRTIDQIIVKGYDKFPRSFIKYFAGLKKGKIFNQNEVVNQSELLNSLGFVSNIKPPEVLFKEDSTVVYIYLKKQNNNLFDGVLGFSSDDDSQKLIFNGYLNLELNNNLNFGERLSINFKADGKEQQHFKAAIDLPYLFRSPFGIGAELRIFKKDSSFSTTDQQIRVNYQVDLNTKVYSGYKHYESNNLLDEIISEQNIQDYKSDYVLAGLNYERFQSNLLFPVKGRLVLHSEIGQRKITNTSESQIRLTGIINHIFNLNLHNSIFIQNQTSWISSDTYLTNELFRFGGINSIRGFDENSIDASLFTVLNSEYRYQFNAGLYLNSIIDIAYFENDLLKLKENLYSFGLGMGIQTKAGLFKFIIANGNSENQDLSFNNTKIHVSLTSRF
jgi:outer membrane protein assembly factor BamA